MAMAMAVAESGGGGAKRAEEPGGGLGGAVRLAVAGTCLAYLALRLLREAVRVPAFAPDDGRDSALPSSYRLLCGGLADITELECKGKKPVEVTYQRDRAFGPSILFGNSNYYDFETDCGPFCRQERSGPLWGYRLPIRPGRYLVRVYGHESWFLPGERMFDVSVQGRKILENLDLAQLVGKDTMYTYPTAIADVNEGSRLEIEFRGSRDNGLCNAIQVLPIGKNWAEERIQREAVVVPRSNPVCSN